MHARLSERPAPGGAFGAGSRIGLGTLINFLRRAAMAHRAGIDVLGFWKKESEHGPADLRRAAGLVHERLRAGDTLAEATAATRGYFPSLMVEMIEVGETTGRLEVVLQQLHQHYEHLRDLRRSLLLGLLWPGIQLTVAVGVVGLLIWVVGFIAQSRGGEPVDILGLGLVGNSGLAIYVALVLSVAAACGFLFLALRQGWFGSTPLKLCLRVPVVGGCFRTAALARFTWTLGLALESGLDARRAMRLALRSSQLPHWIEATERADEVILRGGEFHEACRAADDFPDDFVTSLAAAEQAQAISESLHHLSQDYYERSKSANRLLTMFASFAIWGGVACLIILLIFRLFSFYMGILDEALNDAANPTGS